MTKKGAIMRVQLKFSSKDCEEVSQSQFSWHYRDRYALGEVGGVPGKANTDWKQVGAWHSKGSISTVMRLESRMSMGNSGRESGDTDKMQSRNI